MSVKVYKWHSVAERKWSEIQHSGPLSALGSQYSFFSHPDGRELSPDMVPEGGAVHAVPRPGAAVAAAVVVAVVTTIITYSLLPEPEIPNSAGQSKTSPNNQPGSQSNTARLGQGIPDIRGIVKSYPDMVQSPWYFYDTNTQIVKQKFCVGLRTFDPTIVEIKVGETDIDNISGASYTWTGGAALGSDQYDAYYPARNEGVESVVVRPENESTARGWYFKSNAATNQIEIDAGYLPNYPSVTGVTAQFGDMLELDGTKSFNIYEISGGPAITEDGYFEYSSRSIVTKFIDSGGTLTSTTVHVFTISNRTIAATQTIYEDGGTLDLKFDVTRGDVSAGGWSSWQYIKPMPYAMLNIAWPQSILNSSGDPTSMSWEFQYTDGASTYTASRTKTAYTNSPVYQSVLLAATSGNLTRFRVRRTTADTGGPNDMTIDSCFSLSLYSSIPSGVALLSTTYRGGRYATQPTTGNVSIVPQADYYTYNGTSVVTGPFTGTRSFADSVLMDFVLVYGTYTATIKEHVDLDELYDIHDALSANLKAFSYTFDDTDIDLETRIQTACNCARVTAYRQGQKWRFTRDEAKPVTAIFNRRNIAGTSENEMAVSFQKPLDKNGVTIRYVDYTTGKEAYVHRSIGASSFTTDQPSRPLEIDLAGCDNATQAENRADLEVRKLVYQRRTVKERVLMDGLNVAVGDRVKWASIYDGDIFHGECLEIAGSQDQFLYTSEPLWQTGTLYLHYTDTNGDVIGPVQVEGWTNGIVNSSGLAFPGMFTADDDNQAGSYLIVGTTDNLEYSDMTITSVAPRDDGTVDIEMIEYNEAIYSED